MYLNILLPVLLVLPGFDALGQISPSTNQNYIYTRTIVKEGVKTVADLAALPSDSVRAEIQYLDGLGRPVQHIAVRNSPNKKDIIVPIKFDAYGRQDKTYLAYEHNSQTGAYQSTAIESQASFFNSAGSGSIPKISLNPYGQVLFDDSPLDRVMETAAPGDSWKLGAGHTIRKNYESNSTADQVRLWNMTTSGNNNTGASSSGYYAAGELYKNITWDENRNRIIEYKDKAGLVICKKIQDGGDTLSAPTYMITQYIYDAFNRLAYIVPSALEAISSFTESDANFLNYIYAYHYDAKRRVTEKKIPGSGWIYMVYNNADMPVLAQDSMQRVRGVWGFIKYDTLGRAIMTGETANTSSRSALQLNADGRTRQFENRDSTLSWGYTISAIPTSISKVFTVNFYDDYSFLRSTVNQNPIPSLITQPAGTATESNRTKGFATIAIINVLDSNRYLYNVTYYDEKERPTKVVKQHLLNGADVTTNTLNFVGEVTSSTRKHYANGNITTPVVTITTTNQYDHAGRIVRAIEKIDALTPDTITYAYNEVGQLFQKKVGNQTIGTFFNARGWVKKQTSPLFTLELKYDSTAVAINKQFNGNIGQQLWKSGSGTQTQHTYTYSYDKADRITSGISDEGYNEQQITYDKIGNIKTLTRPKDSSMAITYSYGAKGNQLQNVSGGYARAFTYNGNGSVLSITGTQPLTISYNAINLPKAITGSATVSYVYDAAGNKLKKSTPTETRWYIDGIEYITNSTIPNPVIDLLHTQEGIARKNGALYNYEYFLKDHLGNTRIVFNKAGTVYQQTDYYPYGMSIMRAVYPQNRYLYNGKEQQQELGGTTKGQYDFGSRFYDPILGRWHVVDPLAELIPRHSVYNYTLNNPTRFVDPDGMAALRWDDWYETVNPDGSISRGYWDASDDELSWNGQTWHNVGKFEPVDLPGGSQIYDNIAQGISFLELTNSYLSELNEAQLAPVLSSVYYTPQSWINMNINYGPTMYTNKIFSAVDNATGLFGAANDLTAFAMNPTKNPIPLGFDAGVIGMMASNQKNQEMMEVGDDMYKYSVKQGYEKFRIYLRSKFNTAYAYGWSDTSLSNNGYILRKGIKEEYDAPAIPTRSFFYWYNSRDGDTIRNFGSYYTGK
ncbi:hypothetical protein A8C56_11350 [Niabella ginsenosidivorans]|uniref:DUF6443 domain-containing protein n=2 Tax=Niabella ginsenosidivorans TaxID=1176587 RepID=A0A1A9I4K8_9BACT|nr:hypothetical protein A8C56_11350 [Niabella ginsenosidivorans]